MFLITTLLTAAVAMGAHVRPAATPSQCPEINSTRSWYSEDAKASNFSVPIITDEETTSFVSIDAPSTWNATLEQCVCPDQLLKFTFWSTTGTYANNDTDCAYECDRCQVVFCVRNYEDGLADTYNVVVASGEEPACDSEPASPTTTITSTSKTTETATATETGTNDDDLKVNVGVQDGSYNYTYIYPPIASDV